ncbi:MAG: glycosyl transferase family 4, partial [Euryarchaeota archaeon]|nr:glycosyl transferase family 4 [Euryarchaeota archaeon]
WIRAARRIGLVGRDMNKHSKPEVAEMGGIAVVSGFVAGVLYYIALSTFYFRQDANLIFILATLSTVLIITIIGMLDDILGWKIGLKQWQKPLLTLVAALPMVAVNAGQSSMVLPLAGNVDFGILYPLLIVPLGIAGAANGFNMLAGYNGLEAGMGIIILSAMGFVAWQSGMGWVALLAGCMVLALLAFLRYNWFPARVFPGDSMTYSVGALIACVAILGNMEKIALVLFLPYFLDFVLPLRKRMKVEAFGKPRRDGSLELPYSRIYDTAHAAILLLKRLKGRAYEYEVTLLILAVEAVIAVLAVRWFLG